MKLNPQKLQQLEEICELAEIEFDRISMGYQARGPCESLCCNFNEGTGKMWIADDWADVTVDPEKILEQLRSIPDEANYDEVWECLQRFDIDC